MLTSFWCDCFAWRARASNFRRPKTGQVNIACLLFLSAAIHVCLKGQLVDFFSTHFPTLVMTYDVNTLKDRAQCLDAKASLEAELDGY